MGTVTFVRHGQASFGAADYDCLSPLGERQCEALGAYLAARGRRFDAVVRGTLRRHRQSLDAIARQLEGLPVALEWPALDEYDGVALVRALVGTLPPVDTRDGYKHHFRLLREALAAWMDGRIEPAGMPSWPAFRDGVGSALGRLHAEFPGDVLVVSSGGPISTAVAQVLGAPGSAMIELNMRLRNSALTEFVGSRTGHALAGFNAVPHLDVPGREDWITWA